MRQRVGFAGRSSCEPDALLMDEPFSALDVLTAREPAHRAAQPLGRPRDFPTKAILIVTHNIEEAVQLADRIFVLTSNPGRLRAADPRRRCPDRGDRRATGVRGARRPASTGS